MYKFVNILVILMSYSYFLVKHRKKSSFMFILSTFKYYDRENDCLKQLKHHFKPFLIKMKVICAWCESVLGCCSLSISVYTRGSPVLFPIFTVNEGASHRLGSKKPKKKKKTPKFSLLLTSVNILLQLKLISPWKMWLKKISFSN